MELQEQDIALLEAYLAGELAGEDLRACEARLQTEPELAETLEMMKALAPATRVTAQVSLKREMQTAKAAAIAAGMASYQPSINAPSRGGFFKRLFKFLLSIAITGGLAWLVWKYVLHEQLPGMVTGMESSHSESKSTTIERDTTTTIKRDTVWNSKPKRP